MKPYPDDMRDRANEAEAELIALVGFTRTREMLAAPSSVRQNGPDDLPHFLLTVICNRRAEAAAAEASARRHQPTTIERTEHV